jgi:hypothetical protein
MALCDGSLIDKEPRMTDANGLSVPHHDDIDEPALTALH